MKISTQDFQKHIDIHIGENSLYLKDNVLLYRGFRHEVDFAVGIMIDNTLHLLGDKVFVENTYYTKDWLIRNGCLRNPIVENSDFAKLALIDYA